MLVFVTSSTYSFNEIARIVGDSISDLPEKPSVAIFGATSTLEVA